MTSLVSVFTFQYTNKKLENLCLCVCVCVWACAYACVRAHARVFVCGFWETRSRLNDLLSHYHLNLKRSRTSFIVSFFFIFILRKSLNLTCHKFEKRGVLNVHLVALLFPLFLLPSSFSFFLSFFSFFFTRLLYFQRISHISRYIALVNSLCKTM